MRLERIAWEGVGAPTETDLRRRLAVDGFEPFVWTDAPGADYAPHAHDHDECLWCLDGEITFRADGRDLALRPGDRLMLPRGTVHTARAGARGATYLIGQR